MTEVLGQIAAAVVCSMIGGAVTGLMALTRIRVEMQFLRRDVDLSHKRMDDGDVGRRLTAIEQRLGLLEKHD